VTLAVLQALPGYTSEARWLRFARAHLRYLFPYLPGQPGYNSLAGRPEAPTCTDAPAGFRKSLISPSRTGL
jgi:hypothetical protein